MMRYRWMLLAPVAVLLAQDASVIRVTTRMVEVNVIVRDHNGPVTGLTKDDFTIFDKGKPQKIAFFAANTVKHAAPATASPAAQQKMVFTNRPALSADAASSVTVVLLDGLNTHIQDQVYAKQQFVKFLAQIRPDDHVGVYTLGSELKVLHDFSSDSRSLLNAVAKFNGQNLPFVDISEPDPQDTGDLDLDGRLNNFLEVMADQAIKNRVRLTSVALIAIANHMSHLPGRKNLIWVSASFPFALGGCGGENPTNWNAQISEIQSGQQANCMGGPIGGGGRGRGGMTQTVAANFSDLNRETIVFDGEIRRAMEALNAANVAMYPVDARGLTSLPKQFTAAMGPINRSVAGGGAPAAHADVQPTGTSVMEKVAVDTGGRAFYNTNDIQGAIRKAMDDSDVTYTLGFYPDSKTLDSQFHALKVEVAKKGVELRYRKGYTPTPDSLLTDDNREQVVKDALWSPLASTGITIAATMNKIDKAVRITLIIDPMELEFTAAEGKRKAELEIAFEQRSADGHDLGKTEQLAPIALDEDRYQSKQPLTLTKTLTKTLTPAGGLSEVRIAVFDRHAGKVGSLIVPIK
jgi:VWFA-related protein